MGTETRAERAGDFRSTNIGHFVCRVPEEQGRKRQEKESSQGGQEGQEEETRKIIDIPLLIIPPEPLVLLVYQ
jgi:hypothetical protein